MTNTAVVIRDDKHYLEVVADTRNLLARIGTVEEAKDLADKARAAQVWAQRARLGQEHVNVAAITKVYAERKAGELLQQTVSVGRPDKWSPNVTISDLGISKRQSSEWQKLAAVTDEQFEDAVEAASQEGIVTTSKVQRMAVHYSSATDQWSTPQDLFDLLNYEFQFDLDVCATHDNAKCDRYFTEEDNGLEQDWAGTCWMNPPYGNEISEWMRKAFEQAHTHGIRVVCLVPARVDTGWWWDYARHGEVRFLRGRLKFGGGTMGAPFPSAVVIFGSPARVIWWETWK